ncbi:hypothetical protein PR001_g23818 [Phytophthora rubi]|uniref:Uncharacterized protein n=1 Tax=Phytophthora rubi TaxID=129364 RepID=A0A6A3IN07_9STRA|nr:hypothetical protein PR002_g23811 [Phytophthora rubi]KAE8982117.1 hypothetical protein PR001_g23818 [Phytophthora rubi]
MVKGILEAERAAAGTAVDESLCEHVKESVCIHPHSSVFTPNSTKLPQFAVFQHTMRTTRGHYPEHDTSDAKDGLAGKYRWFVKFVLDGQVITSLLPCSAALKESSHALTRKAAGRQPAAAWRDISSGASLA